MAMHSRRDFLKTGAAGLLGSSAFFGSNSLFAQTLGLPPGLQLYSVRKELPDDYVGTLKQVGALGYRQVEAAGYFSHTADEVKKAMRDAGLSLVSAHYGHDDFQSNLDKIIEFNKRVGVQYLICASPGIKNPARLKNGKPKDWADAFTMEDWRWNAEQFNKFGKKVHAAGLKFGYHNHTMAFKRQKNGEVPYIELLKLTDPSLVTMEMDCGWVVVGGGNPVELLERYPTRISMLHIKDFKFSGEPMSVSNPPQSAELGRGSIDYRPIFKAAAKTGHIKHAFVEQEQYVDMPTMQALKVDAEYMMKYHA